MDLHLLTAAGGHLYMDIQKCIVAKDTENKENQCSHCPDMLHKHTKSASGN